MYETLKYFRVAKCKGRLVTAHCWDTDDPRLLICRAQKPEARDSKSLKASNESDVSFRKIGSIKNE